MNWVRCLAFSILLSSGVTGWCVTPTFTLTDLGTFGGEWGTARAINDVGQITGGAGMPGSDPWEARAFLWSNGTMVDISPGPYEYGLGLGINAHGQVVGVSGGLGFTYKAGRSSYIDVSGASSVDAYDVNDAGQIAGEFVDLAGVQAHGFVMTNGVLHDIGTIGNGRYSVAKGINNRGDVVGYATVNAAGTYAPAILYSDGLMHAIGPYNSEALDINDSQVATGTGDFAFWYDHQSTTFRSLGSLPGRDYSYGSALNNAGYVVGYSSNHDGEDSAGFVVLGGSMHDLNELLLPASAVGWTVIRAHDINSAGHIVGDALNPAGEQRAVLLSPLTPLAAWTPPMVPEPATCWLMAGGLVLLCAMRPRPSAPMTQPIADRVA